MALDQVPEQVGVKVFLMDFYSQLPVKPDDFREAAGFPVLLKCLLHEKPFLEGSGLAYWLIGNSLCGGIPACARSLTNLAVGDYNDHISKYCGSFLCRPFP